MLYLYSKEIFRRRLSNLRFLARDSIYARYMLSSVTWVDQSKTVEDRIMQLSPQSSPMTLVSSWLTYGEIPKGT